MPDTLTRGDSIIQWLTGAASDGGSQPLASASLGNFRSTTPCKSWSVQTAGLSGVTIVSLTGLDQAGTGGSLQAVDANTLRWRPPGQADYGPAMAFSGTAVAGTVEGPEGAGSFLKVTVTTPLTPGAVPVTVSVSTDAFLAFPPVTQGQTVSGVSHYRASMAKNGSANTVTDYKLWLGLLGTPAITNGLQLNATDPGSLQASAGFADWPQSGWAQIRQSNGTHRETVYYGSRTADTLTVTVRQALGTTASAGAASDVAYPVPGIAIAVDPTGVQAGGTGIQVVANANTAPAGVTWNHGIASDSGLDIGDVAAGDEVGIWIWRQIPAGAVASPAAYNNVIESFSAY